MILDLKVEIANIFVTRVENGKIKKIIEASVSAM